MPAEGLSFMLVDEEGIAPVSWDLTSFHAESGYLAFAFWLLTQSLHNFGNIESKPQ
jgi:hypothetical protein